MSTTSTPADGSSTIVFVDGSLANYQQIAASVPAGDTVVVIDGGQDGIAQITDYLATTSNVGAIHIVSHGADGELDIGTSDVTADSLGQYADQIAGWKAALAPGADILLYGCSIAADGAGQQFVDRIASLTGATVAASSNDTGAAASGGDWNLEFSTGQVTAPTLDDPSYDGLLSHFRAASLTWTPGSGNTINFAMQMSFRTDYNWYDVTQGNKYTTSPAVGDILLEGDQLYFGDGQSAPIYMKITAISTTQDYFVADLVTSTGAPITHNYTNPGSYTAYWQSSARLSTLSNFANDGWRTQTLIDVGAGNSPPVSSLPPIIQVAKGQLDTFQIPVTDPNGDPLSFSIGTGAQFDPSQPAATPIAPAGVTLSTSGLLTWGLSKYPSVTSGQQYVMTATVSDLDATGKVKSTTPLDFILQVVDTTTSTPPSFTLVPPTQTAIAGILDAQAVTATDPQGALTNIQVLNPPTGFATEYHADEGELHLNFTPTKAEIGTSSIVSIQAIDNIGLTAQTSVTYNVISPAPVVTAGTPAPVTGAASVVIGTVKAAQAGDVLAVTQTPDLLGTVSLGAVANSVRQILYTGTGAAKLSVVDHPSYTITDTTLAGQITDPTISAATTATGAVQIDVAAPPVVSLGTPAAVEGTASVVLGTVAAVQAGDVLALTQASDPYGTVSLGAVANGVQQILYKGTGAATQSVLDSVSYTITDATLAASQPVGSAASFATAETGTVQIDAGPVLSGALSGYVVSNGTTTALGTVAPGLAGDVLSVTSASSAGGSVSLGAIVNGVQQIIYTAPSAPQGADAVSYTVVDQHGAVAVQGGATLVPVASTGVPTVQAVADLIAAISQASQAPSSGTGTAFSITLPPGVSLSGTATTTLNLAGGDTLTIHGDDATLTGGGVVLQGTGTLHLSSTGNKTLTISEDISGTGGLTVVGGNVELTTSNSYTGDTFVDGGKVVVSGSGVFGTGTVHLVDPSIEFTTSGTDTNDISLDSADPVNDPNTFTVDTGVTETISGAITTGTGTNDQGEAIDPNQIVRVTGPGTLILANSNDSWSGGTIVDGGATLSIDAAGEVGTGGFTIGDASMAGTLQTTNAGALTLAGDVAVGEGGATVDVTNADADTTLNGNISGSALTKGGDGTLILTGAATNAELVVDQGTLALGLGGTLTTDGAGAGAGTAVSVAAGATFENGGTITASNRGVGLAGGTFDNGGTLTATNGDGVYATSGAVTVSNTGTGTISGTNGVDANLTTSDAITTTGAGSFTGTSGSGIIADSMGGAVAVGTTAAPVGEVSGTASGILASSTGTGTVDVVTGGDVTGTSGDGIQAAGTDGVSVTTTAGDVTGGIYGVQAVTFGSGPATVTTASGETIQGGNNAIDVQGVGSAAGLLTVTNAAALTRAGGRPNGYTAVNVVTAGTRGTTIASTGAIDGSAGAGAFVNGIYTRSNGTAGDVSITTSGGGTVGAGTAVTDRGLDAETIGSGTVSITADATVRSGNEALYGLAEGTGSVTVGGSAAVSGGVGVHAYQTGNATGTNAGVTVQGTGGTTGTAGDGIDAEITGANDAGAVSVTRSGAVSATAVGINASTAGLGTVTVTTGAGAVTGNSGGGTTAADVGIAAASSNAGASGAVSVTTGNGAVSGVSGIKASSAGTGAGSTVTVTVNGNVSGTGTAAGSAGVSATGVAGKVEVDQKAGTIASGLDGIDATATGAGAVVVNQSGGQIGTGQASVGGVGISATRATAGAITVTAQAVSATGDGIDATNTGSGAGDVSVTANGSVASANGTSVEAQTSGTGAVTVTGSGAVSGGGSGSGIVAYQNNTATGIDAGVTVSGTGATTSASGDGIDAEITGANNAGDISVTRSGSVTASSFGIFASSQGTGDITIGTAQAPVASSGSTISSTSGNAIVVEQAQGAVVINTGAGTIQNSAGVSAIAVDAIAANGANVGTGSSVTINNAATIRHTTAGVTGGVADIKALSAGAGGITISDTGALDGAFNTGVTAIESGSTGGVSVTTSGTGTIGATTAPTQEGVYAETDGSGAVTVTANAAMTAASGTTYGIEALAKGTGAVTVGGSATVTGGTGIYAHQQGTGASTAGVTVQGGGATTASTGAGIDAAIESANDGGNVNVTRSGAVQAVTTGIHAATAGTGTVTVTAGAVTTTNGSGIVATATSGAVAVSATGNVSAGGTGNAGLYLTGTSANDTATVASGVTVQGAIGLRVNGGTTALSNSGTIRSTATNAVQVDAGTLVIGQNAGTLTGNIALSAAGSHLTVARTSALALGNTITGAGSLTDAGTGTLTLTGTNSYAGGTTFASGTLDAVVAAAIGTGGTLSFTGGTLQYGGSNTQDYSSRFSNGANQAYRVDTNGHAVTYAGNLTSSGGTLTKLGTGTLDLTGAEGYTGATLVSGGTLLVDGSDTASAFEVQNGATLGGHGTIGAVTVDTGGFFAPGNSPGQMTVASLTLSQGSYFQEQLGGATPGNGDGHYDQTIVQAGGTVNLSGATLQLSNYGGYVPYGNESFDIIVNNTGNAVQGTFAGLQEGATTTIGGETFTITYTGSQTGGAGTGNDVVLTEVDQAPTASITTDPYAAVEQTPLSLQDGGLSIADADGGNSNGNETATLTVGEGTLTATAGNNVTVGASNGGKTVAVTGTVAQIDAFLNGSAGGTLTYIDNTDTPSATTALTLSANDGALTSNTARTTITIQAVNDAPTIVAPSGYAATEKQAASLQSGSLTVGDVDGGSGTETATLSVGEGTLAAAAGSTGVVVTGQNSGTLVLNGTVAQLDALLQGGAGTGGSALTYTDALDAPSASTQLTLTIDDDGNTGSGGAMSAQTTSTITITGVNQAPTATAPASGVYQAVEQIPLSLKNVGLSIADPDGANSAETVVLMVGQGVLSADAGDSGATVASGSGTGMLTVTGTVTQVNAFLNGTGTSTLSYTDGSDTPSASTTLNLQVTDASQATGTAATTIAIQAVNDAPTAAAGTATYQATEQTALNLQGSGLSVGDVDGGGGTETATLSVGEGTLTAIAGGTGTASNGLSVMGSGTGTVMLTGTLAQINALLAGGDGSTLSYTDGSDTPSANTTLTLSIDDGGNTGSGGSKTAQATATIDVTAVNDAPVATVPNVAYRATEQTPLNLKNTGLSVSDVDGGTGSETATLTVGEGTLSATAGNSNAGVSVSGDGKTVTITGTTAQIDAVLNGQGTSTLGYVDPLDAPSASTQLTLTIDDDGNTGTGPTGGYTTSASQTIYVAPVNDAPTASAPANLSAVEQTPLTLAGAGLSVGDVDGGTGIETATLSVGEGTLTAAAGTQGSAGLAVSNSGTNTVTLKGTVAQIDALLQGTDATGTLSYSDDTDIPSADTTLTLSIDDGGNTGAGGAMSAQAQSTIAIQAVNDAPVATAATATYQAVEQTTLNLKNTGLLVSDVDGGTGVETATLSVGEGAISADAGNSGAQVSGSGSGTVTITGTLDEIDGVLGGQGTSTLSYFDNSDTPSNAQLTLSVNDGGNTGSGGAKTGVATAAIDVAPVDDAPVATSSTPVYQAVEQTALDLKSTGLSVSDVDGGAGVETATLSVGEGTLTASAGDSGASVGGSGSGTVTISGTVAQIDAVLNGAGSSTLSYGDNTDTPSPSTGLTLTVNDNGNTGSGGALTSQARSTIALQAVNDAPIATAGTATYQAVEKTDLNLKNTGLSVSDVDGGAGIETATLSVGEGMLDATAGDSGASVAGSGSGTVTISGTTAQIDAVLGGSGSSTLGYVDANNNPSASTGLTLTVNDNGNTGSGGALSSSAQATIDVTSHPDVAILASTISFDGKGTFTLDGFASSAAGVANVEISAVVDEGQRVDLGAATLNPDGSFSFVDHVGPHLQGFITATETDDLGQQATADFHPALQGGLAGNSFAGQPYVARLDAYDVSATDVTYTASAYFHPDGSRTVDVAASDQTFHSHDRDTFLNHGAGENTFVFDPGYGLDVVKQFRVDGFAHGAISLLGSDFGNDIATVLRDSRNVKGGVAIVDPTSHDVVKLTGVSKAQLVHNQTDFVFHN